MKRTTLVISASAVLLLGGAAILFAGPLNPPSGAVSSTYKTLSEVEPRIAINATNTPGDSGATPSLYKITQPGSYYLTSNVTGVSGKIGIEVAAEHATIDLNGYTLLGVPGSLDGISVTTAGSSLAVRDGNVAFWGGDGIRVDAGLNQCVENVKVWLNGGDGIYVGSNSIVRGCIAAQNGGVGISLLSSGVASQCASRSNGGGGFQASVAATFENCSARENTGNGFTTGANSTIRGCATYGSSLNGFSCSVSTLVTACSAYGNGANGFDLSGDSSIIDSVSTHNTGDGIRLVSQCVARGNTCVVNGYGTGNAAGIHAAGNDNRIEGNQCTSSDHGIDVDGTGNIIMRNTCAANTINWTIVGGNTFLIVVTNKTSSNFSGDAGGGGYGSTDPNANFTY